MDQEIKFESFKNDEDMFKAMERHEKEGTEVAKSARKELSENPALKMFIDTLETAYQRKDKSMVRRLGQSLHDQGGFELMQAVNSCYFPDDAFYGISEWWHGIGEWEN